MTATFFSMARALAMLLVAWLALRGAVGAWQQFAEAEASTTASPTPSTMAPQSSAAAPTARSTLRDVDAPPRQPGPDPSAIVVSWRALEASASFVEGHAGPIVVAFIDLDCAFCAQLWRRLRAPVAAGRIRVRWIPVAVVQPAGAWRAAALLRAADPVAALAAHADRMHAAAPAPAIAPAPGDDIAANNALLAVVTGGRPATPVLMWRVADLTLRLSPGLPQELAAVLDGAH